MAKATTLPEGVTAEDLKVAWDDVDYSRGDYGSLTLHKTERFGWCISTLFISRGKRGQPDRSYAIPLKGEGTVSIGNGPHVTQTITVQFSKSRPEALAGFHDRYVEGLKNANSIRDRRSSRIAKGQEMRAAGRTSWRWDE